MSGGHGLLGVADAGAFLARLTRLDPASLVRLKSAPGCSRGRPRTALWGRLPWQTLVTRTVDGQGPADATVSAADLLAVLGRDGADLPPRRDAGWMWPLPPTAGQVVETIPAQDLVRVEAAAVGTLRAAVADRRGGERLVRDALLDHVAIVVTDKDVGRVEIPQRLVQAIVRMGFLGAHTDLSDKSVQVGVRGRWIGLMAPYGTAWLRDVSDMTLWSLHVHTNG